MLHMALSGVDHSSHAQRPCHRTLSFSPPALTDPPALGQTVGWATLSDRGDLQPRRSSNGGRRPRWPDFRSSKAQQCSCLARPISGGVSPFRRVSHTPPPSLACCAAKNKPSRSLLQHRKYSPFEDIAGQLTVLSFVSLAGFDKRKLPVAILLIVLSIDLFFLRRRLQYYETRGEKKKGKTRSRTLVDSITPTRHDGFTRFRRTRHEHTKCCGFGHERSGSTRGHDFGTSLGRRRLRLWHDLDNTGSD